MSGFTYNGYLYLALAITIPSTEKWESRVSISKPHPDEPKNVKEHFFKDVKRLFDSEDDAIQAAHVTAKALIDRTIDGLDF